MDNPYTILERKDMIHSFLCLCSFVCILENKKLNLANVFLLKNIQAMNVDATFFIYWNKMCITTRHFLIAWHTQHDYKIASDFQIKNSYEIFENCIVCLLGKVLMTFKAEKRG